MTDENCFNCFYSIDSHSKNESIFCLRELSEKLELFSEMLDLQKIRSKVDSLETGTLDSDVQEVEQDE